MDVDDDDDCGATDLTSSRKGSEAANTIDSADCIALPDVGLSMRAALLLSIRTLRTPVPAPGMATAASLAPSRATSALLAPSSRSQSQPLAPLTKRGDALAKSTRSYRSCSRPVVAVSGSSDHAVAAASAVEAPAKSMRRELTPFTRKTKIRDIKVRMKYRRNLSINPFRRIRAFSFTKDVISA